MSTIRSFIAIEIDQSNRHKVSSLVSSLKKSNADVKWLKDDQMHLTLKFLGNIQRPDIQKISWELKEMLKAFKTFNIRFSKIGGFPSMDHPRVIWLGIDKGSDVLKDLNNKVEKGLGKIGIKKEGREYRAHLTLGRVRSLKNIPELVRLIKETDICFQDEIKIERIVLFQSTLTKKGAIYTSLGTYDLLTTPCKQPEGSD